MFGVARIFGFMHVPIILINDLECYNMRALILSSSTSLERVRCVTDIFPGVGGSQCIIHRIQYYVAISQPHRILAVI